MGSVLNFKNPSRTINVGVILMNATTEVQDVAPVDLLSSLSKETRDELQLPEDILPEAILNQAIDIKVHWVNETGGTAQLTSGLKVQATHSFANAPPLDIVLMGASGMQYKPSEAELKFVRKAYDECSHFLTICAGSHVPLLAGLLKGKEATGPLMILGMWKQHFPDTKWVEKRWHRDGKFWTSGALLNGLDLMRAFITEVWGDKGTLAGWVMRECGVPNRDVDYKDD